MVPTYGYGNVNKRRKSEIERCNIEGYTPRERMTEVKARERDRKTGRKRIFFSLHPHSPQCRGGDECHTKNGRIFQTKLKELPCHNGIGDKATVFLFEKFRTL